MEKILIYLNGKRGLKVLEALINFSKYNLFVFSSKAIPELEELDYNKSINYKIIENINDKKHLSCVKNLNPYISIVAGFSMIFSQELINVPKLGTINLHAGPLPKYRGGSPLNWQIINGEKNIGLSIIQMDKGIDTGQVLCQDYFELNNSDNINNVHENANNLFCNMILQVLNKIENQSLHSITQENKNAIYWHQRSDLDGRINWKNMTAIQVHNFIRALAKPYHGAYTYFSNYKLRIFSSKLIDENFYGCPGRVVKIKDNKLVVICFDKGLYIEKYKFEEYSGSLVNGMHLI